MGTFYIVSTPIGNLEDITIRAIKTLFTVDVIACEDTRKTGQLLWEYRNRIKNQELQIKGLDLPVENPHLLSYYDEIEEKRLPELIGLLQEGKDVALVSDAGTPLVADPGYRIVRECIRRKIPVIPIPGPSSILAALAVSGLPANQFLFLGYLPPTQQKRLNQLMNIFQLFKNTKAVHPTLVFFESPHRIWECLVDTQEVFGDIDLVITRELTKVHEEMIRGKISEVLASASLQAPKGEFVILISYA